jgi:hypothetical protein
MEAWLFPPRLAGHDRVSEYVGTWPQPRSFSVACGNNPRAWRIEDLKAVALRYDIGFRQHGTSHVTFVASDGRVRSVPATRPIKPYT